MIHQFHKSLISDENNYRLLDSHPRKVMSNYILPGTLSNPFINDKTCSYQGAPSVITVTFYSGQNPAKDFRVLS